jgi:hypothetical protein
MLVVHAAEVTDGSVVMVVREATGQERLPGPVDEVAAAATIASAPAPNSVEMI